MRDFADVDETTLPLSEDRTADPPRPRSITVRKRLNAGEARKYRGMASVPTMTDLALVVAYLLDWTLVDDDGKKVKLRGLEVSALVENLDALESDVFDEILSVVTAHRDRMKAERDAEKNGPDGGKNSPAISPSLVGVAGV